MYGYLGRERGSSEWLRKRTYLESNSARFRNASRRSSLITSTRANHERGNKQQKEDIDKKRRKGRAIPWGEDWTTTTTSLMFLGRITDLCNVEREC